MGERTRMVAATSAAVTAASVVGGLLSDPGSAWYRALRKPAWNPPDAVFPIVWTSLYTDIAVTSGLTLAELEGEGRHDDARAYRRALTANLVLNAGWSWAFFRAHRLPLAAAWAAVLAASSADLVRRTADVDPARGAALAPYAVWTAFATALSTTIWRRNR